MPNPDFYLMPFSSSQLFEIFDPGQVFPRLSWPFPQASPGQSPKPLVKRFSIKFVWNHSCGENQARFDPSCYFSSRILQNHRRIFRGFFEIFPARLGIFWIPLKFCPKIRFNISSLPWSLIIFSRAILHFSDASFLRARIFPSFVTRSVWDWGY